jgi:hypothetical protein
MDMNLADLDTNSQVVESVKIRTFMGFTLSDLRQIFVWSLLFLAILQLISFSNELAQAEEKLSQDRFETQVHRIVTCFCQHRSKEYRSGDVLGMTLMLVMNSERLGDLPLPLLQQATKLSQEPNDMCPIDVRLDDPPQLE